MRSIALTMAIISRGFFTFRSLSTKINPGLNSHYPAYAFSGLFAILFFMKMDLKCQAFLKRVGARLKKIRIEKGWTLEGTEAHRWPSWQHLQKVEAGKNLTLATLWKVTQLYKVRPEEVFKEL